jgi:hypothetical protein
MGADRSLRRVAEEHGKFMSAVSSWSGKHGWVERARAYDQHVAAAETDGIVHALTEARSKNLALVDKLRDHLSTRLDSFIKRESDPTPAWTQALRAMADLERNSFAITEDRESREQMQRVEELVHRFESAMGREPEDV